MLTLTEECTRLYKDYNSKLNNSLILSNFDITERICSYMYLLLNSQYQGYETVGKVQPIVTTMMDQLQLSRCEFTQFNSKPDHLDQLISDAVDQRCRLGIEKQGFLPFFNFFFFIVFIIFFVFKVIFIFLLIINIYYLFIIYLF